MSNEYESISKTRMKQNDILLKKAISLNSVIVSDIACDSA